MRPERVAKVVMRQINKPRPKILVVVGLKNKFFYLASKIIPKKWLFNIVKKSYKLD